MISPKNTVFFTLCFVLFFLSGSGFARIHDIPVGIIGKNGVLFSESALAQRDTFYTIVLPA